MKTITATIIAVLFLLPGIAHPAIVDVTFSGSIISAIDLGGSGAGSVNGEEFSGTFSYDTSIAPLNPNGSMGQYNASVGTLAVTIGQSNEILVNPFQITVRNDDSNFNDYFSIIEYLSAPLPFGADRIFFRFSLEDTTQTAFSDFSLPLSLDVGDFDDMELFIRAYDDENNDLYWITGDVTSLSTNSVPIPGAVWLFGSGLIGLLGIRRKVCK